MYHHLGVLTILFSLHFHYDKRGDFNFQNTDFPFLGSNYDCCGVFNLDLRLIYRNVIIQKHVYTIKSY